MNRGFAWSAALHVSFFLVFLLAPGPKAFQWDRVEAIPVDLVAMPAVEPPQPEPQPAQEPEPEPVKEVEPPAETPKEAPPPAPKPVQEVRPKPKPKPQKVFKRYAPPKPEDEPSLAERLRERLEEVDEADEAEPTPEAAAEATPPPAAPAPTAEVEAVDFPYAWYLNVLHAKIYAAWDPPGERMLAGHRRQVVVRFRIHRDGTITDVAVDGASGTPGLDASARRAVEQGGPYPPLPEAYDGDWLDLGVRFTVAQEGR